jgi:antitoxin ParD1/3/4
MRAWVRKQATQGGFRSVDEYIGKLLQDEKLRQLRDAIDEKLMEGLNSGPATEMTDKDWARIRREGLRRLAARKGRK